MRMHVHVRAVASALLLSQPLLLDQPLLLVHLLLELGDAARLVGDLQGEAYGGGGSLCGTVRVRLKGGVRRRGGGGIRGSGGGGGNKGIVCGGG